MGTPVEWEIFYFERDLLGNITAVYSAEGVKLVSYLYDAWGNFTTTYHNGGEDTAASLNPFKYRGYYYDSDLGFYYLESRYYDQNIRRFISPDEVDYLGANGDLSSFNLYAYCSNNPVNCVDYSGHVAISLVVGLVVSFIIGTTASAISQYAQYGDVNWLQAGVDGLFAVASTALAYTGIGLIGSMAAGAGMGLAQYTLDSAVFHDDFSRSGALIAAGLGALGGLFSGKGAQHFKSIGSNLDETGRTGVKAILTAFDKYGTGAGYQKVMNLWGNRVANSFAKSISQSFTKSAIIIWVTTVVNCGANYGLGQINWGF